MRCVLLYFAFFFFFFWAYCAIAGETTHCGNVRYYYHHHKTAYSDALCKVGPYTYHCWRSFLLLLSLFLFFSLSPSSSSSFWLGKDVHM